MMKRRIVEFNGQHYKVRSNKTVVPDLATMDRMAALLWLNANTYPKGYSKAPAQSLAFGGAITITGGQE